MTTFQHTYIDGKLRPSYKNPRDIEQARKWLDNAQRVWSSHGLFPLTPVGEFDCNKAHKVDRISADELTVVTTSGRVLRFVNVEKA